MSGDSVVSKLIQLTGLTNNASRCFKLEDHCSDRGYLQSFDI